MIALNKNHRRNPGFLTHGQGQEVSRLDLIEQVRVYTINTSTHTGHTKELARALQNWCIDTHALQDGPMTKAAT